MRISAIEASTRICQRLARERDELAGALREVGRRASAARSGPRPRSGRRSPLSSSHSWTSASAALASSTMLGHVALERRHLVGDRVGEQDADPGDDAATTHEHHDEHREPAREARRAAAASRTGSAAARSARRSMNSSRTGPARAQHRDDAEDRQRQQHELDPARHDHRRDARGRRRVADPASVAPSRAKYALSRADSVPRPWPPGTSILFVGDVVGRAGPARARARCCPGCARSSRPTSSSSTARTRRAASASRPRRPTRSSPPAPTSITLGNHTYRHREVYRYLDEEPRIVRPANYLPSQPGPRHVRGRARRRRRSAWSTSAATCSCRPAARRS